MNFAVLYFMVMSAGLIVLFLSLSVDLQGRKKKGKSE